MTVLCGKNEQEPQNREENVLAVVLGPQGDYQRKGRVSYSLQDWTPCLRLGGSGGSFPAEGVETFAA